MGATHYTFLVHVGGAIVAALVSTGAFAQNVFSQPCEDPSFPGKEVAIDSLCGPDGAKGKEAGQNQMKTRFCAKGTPSTLTFDQLKKLQHDVEQNSKINFGDEDKGPTTNREPLSALGEGKLVQLTAFVLAARPEGDESVNCGHDFDHEAKEDLFHDIHISLVETKLLASVPATNRDQRAASECQGIVAEMIPHHRPPAWTAANVNKVAAKHLPVRVTGQQFFDSSHVPCVDGKAVRSNPKRISLWEVHPVYKFEVCTGNCDAQGTWVSLEKWLTTNK